MVMPPQKEKGTAMGAFQVATNEKSHLWGWLVVLQIVIGYGSMSAK
jgi:hypothetical protein